MPISIYPPTLASTQSAFLEDVSEYPIYFTLLSMTSFDEIGHVLIQIVRLSNNRTIANTSIYPDGIIYKDKANIVQEGKRYRIDISSSTDLGEEWHQGYLYKVQIRFGKSDINAIYSSGETGSGDVHRIYKGTDNKVYVEYYTFRSQTAETISTFSEPPLLFSQWKQKQIDRNLFSEWSTVMIIKAIALPTLSIKNAETRASSALKSAIRTERTLTPLFVASCSIPSQSLELEDKYRFRLFDNDTGAEIESTGWVLHNSAINTVDSHRFKTLLTNLHDYTVLYDVITQNGYLALPIEYSFTAIRTNLARPEDIWLTADAESEYAKENGCIRLYLKSDLPYSGSFVISRTSEKSNYLIYEELHYFTLSHEVLENYLAFTDFTIESGIKYRYGFLQENSEGMRTEMVYSTDKIDADYHVVNFECSYLYRDDILLRLLLNLKMSSFKHTVLRTKQDTIGSRYPFLAQNGNAYYAEFPISGLISYHSDEYDTFFVKNTRGCYYKDELVVPIDKFEDRSRSGNRLNTKVSSLVTGGDRGQGSSESAKNSVAIRPDTADYIHFQSYADAGTYRNGYAREDDIYADKNTRVIPVVEASTRPAANDDSLILPLDMAITTDLTDNNIFIERKFREKVEEFLNDFDYKLYKSPTEGNIIVSLMDVSLTPIESLGRMIYEFSATAYEVLENTLDNLDECGIITIGEFSTLATGEIFESFGLVGEFYNYTVMEDKNAGESVKDDKDNNVVHFDTSLSKTNTTIHTETDIYEKIRIQEEISTGGGYRYALLRVTAIWVETYPLIDLTRLMTKLIRDRVNALAEGYLETDDFVKDIDNKINHLEELIKVLSNPTASLAKITINGNPILVTPGHIYSVEEGITTIKLDQASLPILVNYKCELTLVVDTSVGVASAIEVTEIWGLIFGIFTGEKDILTSYNYNYNTMSGYRVFNSGSSSNSNYIVKDLKGNILFDLTNFNVYRSKNIYDVIAEDARRQVEILYDTKFEEKDGQWTDNSGRIVYSFNDISLFDLETNAGTKLFLSDRSNDANPSSYVIMGMTKDEKKYPLETSSKRKLGVPEVLKDSDVPTAVHFLGKFSGEVGNLPSDASEGAVAMLNEEAYIYRETGGGWTKNLGNLVINDGREDHYLLVDPSDKREYVWKGEVVETSVDVVNRLQFDPSSENIRFIALEKGAFCIVNYKCTTSQVIMSYE